MSFEVTDFGGGEITVTETASAPYCIEASEENCFVEVYETGLTGATGPQGPAGAQGPAGQGVPTGGTTGQVLKKNSNTNYDTVWSNNPTFLTSILGLFKIDANTVGGDPSDGYIRYDNATQTSATALHIDADTDDGLDVTHFLELLVVGNLITIQDKNNSFNLQTWEINALPTLTGDYFIFPVTLISSSGTGTTGFTNNHEILLASFGAAQSASTLDLVSYSQFGGF